ncbi:hypothetical protein FSP39_010325 [Pinctada imbricata]|uniref:FLYWCH-type domain-containing protein n=1 Tax=Pinctada imbricata TaxID=66713 RepID=A0AA88XR25_PINIB|nr:hypothetical protein FSP39_010325 [Pinctada imbricata]
MDHSPTRPMDQTSTQPTHSMDHSPTHSMDHSPTDNSFDVSVLINPTNPINESDIQQNGRNDTILDDEPVTYEIVEKGSKQRTKKLVSSDGYAHTVKKTTQYATYWRCSVRSSTLWCRASVTQRGTTFTPGLNCMYYMFKRKEGISNNTRLQHPQQNPKTPMQKKTQNRHPQKETQKGQGTPTHNIET